MSAVIKINGTDRGDKIDGTSVLLNRALTSQVDTFRFNVIRKGGVAGGGYKPALLDTLTIEENGVIIFAGQITEINENVEGMDSEIFECTAKDFSFDMDRKLVIATYENMAVEDIIEDIKTNFLPAGYTTTHVGCTTVANYIAFNYEQPSKCFQQLAELTGYDWYVDENKDIHFFTGSEKLAPWNITDTSDNIYYGSLKLKSSITSLRNAVYVRGGQYLGTLTAESQIADGTAIIYKQGYQYNTFYVKVNGVTKTVGIDNITDPTTVDCLYNFTEKFVRFPSASKPTAGQTVEVGGYPYIPVIVKVRDPLSIATYGEFQNKIVDKSINSKQGARDRAKAELSDYANKIVDATFETMSVGLEVGQTINVNSTIRGINQNYIISRIQSKLVNGYQFLHQVTLMTSQTYGAIEFLQKLLIQKDKEIEIKAGEVLDEVESVDETVTITESPVVVSKVHNPINETATLGESTTVQALNYATDFVIGDYDTPTGTSRQFILDGSPLG